MVKNVNETLGMRKKNHANYDKLVDRPLQSTYITLSLEFKLLVLILSSEPTTCRMMSNLVVQ